MGMEMDYTASKCSAAEKGGVTVRKRMRQTDRERKRWVEAVAPELK